MSKVALLGVGLLLGAVLGFCLAKVLDHKSPEPSYVTVRYDVAFEGITTFDGPIMICTHEGCDSLSAILNELREGVCR